MSEEKYEKIKFIGEGSYGEVYKARCKTNKDQVCALKYISKHRAKKVILDAKKEIYLLERLRHPNIIQLLESFETKDHIVLVCEYARKELFKTMREEKKQRFSEDKARKIACQICSALFYLHSKRILHRDLKPQNILVVKDGTIKLCDFGFSRFMGDQYYAKTIQGTVSYMAPELFQRSHVHYTEKVDLWALGCIIYELCMGRPPFDSRSLKRMQQMQKDFEPPPDLSPELRRIIRDLLIHDHHKRINWPYILKHPWFLNGIRVWPEDLERESPYTQPELAKQKRHEYHMKVRMVRSYRKIPKRPEVPAVQAGGDQEGIKLGGQATPGEEIHQNLEQDNERLGEDKEGGVDKDLDEKQKRGERDRGDGKALKDGDRKEGAGEPDGRREGQVRDKREKNEDRTKKQENAIEGENRSRKDDKRRSEKHKDEQKRRASPKKEGELKQDEKKERQKVEDDKEGNDKEDMYDMTDGSYNDDNIDTVIIPVYVDDDDYDDEVDGVYDDLQGSGSDSGSDEVNRS